MIKKISLTKVLLTLGVVAAVFLAVFLGIRNQTEPIAYGSIAQAPYKATTTDAGWQGGSKTRVLKLGSGYLGSIVITGATAAAGMNFYDGTTTQNHILYATTSIATVNPSTPAGTYTFDVAFTRGLIVEFPSAIGAASSTITWQ